MGTFSIWHWLVVLAIVVLVFGTKKLRSLGGDLGATIRNFKQSMKEEDEKSDAETPADEARKLKDPEHVIDAEVAAKEKRQA